MTLFAITANYPPNIRGSPAITTGLLDLPGEIRQKIYDILFDVHLTYINASTGGQLNAAYSSSDHLRSLLVCRSWHRDAALFAFSRTLFVVQNPYTSLDIAKYMRASLRPEKVAAIRHLAIVADGRHFRRLRHWQFRPLAMPELQLSCLMIVLRRSSYWHYLFDFNTELVKTLRGLEGVDELVFVRNNAMVKGTLLTWYNRLVKLILWMDRQARFECTPPEAEKSWWAWQYHADTEAVRLKRIPPKPSDLSRHDYDRVMNPHHQRMMLSMQDEEYDPDPFSRVSA